MLKDTRNNCDSLLSHSSAEKVKIQQIRTNLNFQNVKHFVQTTRNRKCSLYFKYLYISLYILNYFKRCIRLKVNKAHAANQHRNERLTFNTHPRAETNVHVRIVEYRLDKGCSKQT